MRKVYLLFAAVFFVLQSCRETEMNTDGNMEEPETQDSEVITVEDEEI